MNRKMRITVALLCVLLICSLLALAGLLIYKRLHPSSYTTTAPGNIISSRPFDTVISMGGDLEETQTLSMPEMMPGDSITKSFQISVQRNRVRALNFFLSPNDPANALAQELYVCVRISENMAVLYDGKLADMPSKLSTELPEECEKLYYEITVTLPTSASNACAGQTLNATLRWWIDSESYIEESEPTEKCAPWCFEACPWCIILPVTALALILLLLLIAVCVALAKRGMSRERAREHHGLLIAGLIGIGSAIGATMLDKLNGGRRR